MTEIEAPRPEAEAEVPPAGVGRRLAIEREKRGLSVADIAGRLRLHPKQVAAIENDALSSLPSAFLRGFVRNYAKELRLDPAPLIAELNARLGPESDGAQALGAGSSGAGRAAAEHLSRPLVIGGVLGALVVFAVLGWLATHSDRRANDIAKQATVAPGSKPGPEVKKAEEAAPRPAEVAPPTAAVAAVPTPAPAPIATAPVANQPAATQPAATSPAPAKPNVATAAAAQPSAPPASPEVLRLSFREQSWVEVTQGDGRVVHSQISEAGSEQLVEGKPPLRVIIGNAPAVSLDYKGKAIDLKAVTGPDNVARITLK